MAASVISCGTLALHVLCFVSRLSLQHELSALGSCSTRRHSSQLSHDTQVLLDASSAQRAAQARLVCWQSPKQLFRWTGWVDEMNAWLVGRVLEAAAPVHRGLTLRYDVGFK